MCDGMNMLRPESDTTARRPRVLLISADKWELGARFSAELRKRGFAVGVIAPRGRMVRKALTGDAYYDFRRFWKVDWFGRVAELWSPDFIICVDDRARQSLLRYYTKALSLPECDNVQMIQLIRKSLGAPEAFPLLEKSRLMTLAARLGVRCPPTAVISDINALCERLDRSVFPVVLKADGGFGGRAVRIVRNRQDAITAFRELQWPVSWPERLKKALGGIAARLPRFPQPQRAVVSLQSFVKGRPANRAVLCWEGKVLAGISAEAIEVSNDTGPATVIKVIGDPELNNAVARMVEHLGITGFCGFDFVLDELRRPWLIEANPRVTPICHIRWGADMIGAFHTKLTGRPPVGGPGQITQDRVALFPHEWLRDPCSPHLYSCYHDIPWDHPRLIQTCLEMRSRNAHAPESAGIKPGIHNDETTYAI
jgi:hypothetical protein